MKFASYSNDMFQFSPRLFEDFITCDISNLTLVDARDIPLFNSFLQAYIEKESPATWVASLFSKEEVKDLIEECIYSHESMVENEFIASDLLLTGMAIKAFATNNEPLEKKEGHRCLWAMKSIIMAYNRMREGYLEIEWDPSWNEFFTGSLKFSKTWLQEGSESLAQALGFCEKGEYKDDVDKIKCLLDTIEERNNQS